MLRRGRVNDADEPILQGKNAQCQCSRLPHQWTGTKANPEHKASYKRQRPLQQTQHLYDCARFESSTSKNETEYRKIVHDFNGVSIHIQRNRAKDPKAKQYEKSGNISTTMSPIATRYLGSIIQTKPPRNCNLYVETHVCQSSKICCHKLFLKFLFQVDPGSFQATLSMSCLLSLSGPSLVCPVPR